MNDKIKTIKRQFVKDAILESARDIVQNKGFYALSIRKIAKDIDYSVGSIYQYFENKDEIVKALIMDKYSELIQSLKIQKVGLSLIETIKDKFMTYCQFALDNQGYYKEMMLSSNPNVLSFTHILKGEPTPGIKMLIHFLELLDKQDGYTIKNPYITAQFLWSSIFGLVIKMIVEGVNDLEMIKQYIDLLLKSIEGEKQ